MADALPSDLAGFLDEVEGAPPDRSLLVVNRSEPEPLQRLLEGAFEGQPVDIGALEDPDQPADRVLLIEAGEVVASSPLSDLMDAFLMVNSDLYKTGTSGLDVDPPAVLAELDETVFSLRGFPASNKEKLLLIVVSRYVERLAWEAGAGTLRSSFQRLSRIDDERGTRRVYENVAATGVDVHVYGVPDARPDDLDVTVHAGTGDEYRRSWFVVYTPPDEEREAKRGAEGNGEHAALVALEVGDNEWEGTWTYRPERVSRIDAYIQREL